MINVTAIERVEEESQSLLSEQNSENEFYDNSNIWKSKKSNRSYQNNIFNSNPNSKNKNEKEILSNSNKKQYKGQINEIEKDNLKFTKNHRNMPNEEICAKNNKFLSTEEVSLKSGKFISVKMSKQSKIIKKISEI